jgi:hypothetical protein
MPSGRVLGDWCASIHPGGDIAAVREMWLCLRVGGLLLLGVPTCAQDQLPFPAHRMYGPHRLPQLLRAAPFRLVGRVWDGNVVRGTDLSAAPTLFPADCGADAWKHQQVLVLRKEAHAGGGVPWVHPAQSSRR